MHRYLIKQMQERERENLKLVCDFRICFSCLWNVFSTHESFHFYNEPFKSIAVLRKTMLLWTENPLPLKLKTKHQLTHKMNVSYPVWWRNKSKMLMRHICAFHFTEIRMKLTGCRISCIWSWQSNTYFHIP